MIIHNQVWVGKGGLLSLSLVVLNVAVAVWLALEALDVHIAVVTLLLRDHVTAILQLSRRSRCTTVVNGVHENIQMLCASSQMLRELPAILWILVRQLVARLCRWSFEGWPRSMESSLIARGAII